MNRKQTLLAAAIVGGTFAASLSPVIANERPAYRSESPTDRYPTKGNDDQTLAPGVPGVTEENSSGISRQEVMQIQTALEQHGYEPGNVDGVMDNDTRAAIREFQADNQKTITGEVDRETAALLGVT